MLQYAAKRALKLFYFLFLPICFLFFILQFSCVQSFLISCFFQDQFEKIQLSSTKGFFPFDFSLESASLESKTKKIFLKNFAIKFKKNLCGIRNFSAEVIDIKTTENKKFSLQDLESFIPFITQKFVRNIEIQNVRFNENKISEIKYAYDKKNHGRSLKAQINDKECFLSYSLNKDLVIANVSIDKTLFNINFEIPKHHISIRTVFSQSDTLNFDGILAQSKLIGVLSSSMFSNQVSLELSSTNELLSAKFSVKDLDLSGELSFDMERKKLLANGITFKNIATVMPFYIDNKFFIENVDILFKEGKIKIKNINLQPENFSLGEAQIFDFDLSNFLGQSEFCGVLSGRALFENGKENFELKLQKGKFLNIPLPEFSIQGSYSKDKAEAKISYDLLKQVNKINFEVLANDWLISKKSKIKLDAKGAFDIFQDAANSSFSGKLVYDFKANGTLIDPKCVGKIALSNGVLMNRSAGIYLKKIEAKSKLSENKLEIMNISATDDTSSSGKISGKGKVDLTSGKTQLELNLDNLRLVDISKFKGRVFGDILIKGESLDSLKISGKLYSNNAEFDISNIIAKSHMALGLIENQKTKVVQAKVKLNLPEIPVDVEFSFKPNLKIVGFGVDSVWEGGAKANGTLNNLNYEAKLELSKGKIKVSGNEFKLSNGKIWTNEKNSDIIFIDVVATKSVSGIKVRARFVQDQVGTDVKFESTPYLSQNDILSYLLFDHSSSEISTGEAFTLFSVMSALSGDQVMDIMSKIKSVLGLDSIELKRVTDDDKEYDALSVGKKIGKMQISVDQGSANDTTKAVLNAKVAKDTKLSVDLYGKNAPGVGIFWNKRY